MGKQQKRPRRRNKDKKKDAPSSSVSSSPFAKSDVNHQEDSSTAAVAAASTPTTTLSALLGRIRHANGQTRLAALSALQQNVLLGQNNNSSGSNNNSNNNSDTASALWQAVREQVLDPTDLAIATTAATCLTEFIVATATTTEGSSSSFSSTALNHHHPMTAGWFLVLIGRLQECHKQQQQQQQQQQQELASSGDQKKNNNKQQQWLALSLQCLHAICALLETNPLVMDRLERSTSLRNDALDTLWQWLDTASSSSLSTREQQPQTPRAAAAAAASSSTAAAATAMDTTTTATAATTTIHHQNHHSGYFDYWTAIQEQACRALHSLTEDNWSTLLLPWLLQEPKTDAEPVNGQQDEVVLVSMAVQLRAFTEIGPRILHQPPKVAAAPASATTTTSVVQGENTSLQVARLHMAGIYLSCHFGAARSKDHVHATPPAATPIIASIENEMPTVLDVLRRGLVWNNSNDLIENLCQAHVKYTQETLDDVLERDILRRQEAKKESARAIARRLQAVKQQQKQQQPQQAANEKEDEEHMDEQEQDGKSGRLSQDRTDARQVWQEALAQWYTSIQSLELALEIFANLTLSMSDNSDDNDGDDEIMHVDDMDDDDIDDNVVGMLHTSSRAAAASNSVVGKVLLQQDADGVVNRLVAVLQQLCQTNATLWQSNGDAMPGVGKSENDDDATAMMMDMSSSPPAVVAESLGELQSKAAAGIGHCLLAFPASSCWSDDTNGDGSSAVTVSSSAFSLWTFLKQCLEQASTAVGRQGIVSTMVVALQSRPMLHKQMQDTDLKLLLSLLTTPTPTTIPATTESVPNEDDKMDESSSLSSHHLVRDAIFMLGMLYSPDEQPVEVKEKVCRALLQTLSACNANTSNKGSNITIEGSIVVVTEILNVLMDMYGSDDDAHAMIFDSLDVLGHFQQTLPLLKQQISVYSSTNRGGQDADLLEGWKETAMNASRFIQYKKGQC